MDTNGKIKMEQPLKTRRILDDEFPKWDGTIAFRTHANAYKAKGVDPDATEARASVDQQALQSRCASGNQPVQRELRDADTVEPELLKEGKVKPLDDVIREAAFSQGGNTEGGREAECGRWRRVNAYSRAGLKLLQFVQSGGPEPGVDGSFRGVEVARFDAEAAAGPRVGGKDVRDDGNAGIDVRGQAAGGELTVVEIERGGAPEVAPPGREDLGAGAVLDGEEGDDVAEVIVVEVADAVDGSSVHLPSGGRFARRFRI